LNVNSVRNKWLELQTYASLFDICVLTETKLDDFVPDCAFALENYQCNRHNRNSNGGGVLTYIRNELHRDTLTIVQQKYRNQGLEITIDAMRTKVKNASTAIVVGLYRPPSARHEWFDTFGELISELLPLGSLIIMGDLNC